MSEQEQIPAQASDELDEAQLEAVAGGGIIDDIEKAVVGAVVTTAVKIADALGAFD